MAGAKAEWDSDVHHTGSWSLRLRFDSTAGAGGPGSPKLFDLEAGHHRLTAPSRPGGIDHQGIPLRGASASPERLDLRTPTCAGSRDWQPVDQDFDVPADMLVRDSHRAVSTG